MTVVEAEGWALYFSKEEGPYVGKSQATWCLYSRKKQREIRHYYYKLLHDGLISLS